MAINDGGIFNIGGLFAELETLVTESNNGLQVSQPASGGAGGYTFTPSELETVLSQWQKLQDSLTKAVPQAHPMTGVQPPASDTASATATSAANQSGQAYLDHLDAMIDYCNKYIQALKTALANYQTAEEGGSHSMRSVNTGL
ncbi:MAG TPA: PE domain-containing protein [Pseudonocardiaceae bacterium]|jgi:hypothetical protein|nr:PE domain-containing protein [Pseudonocardiaceae bacterium]